MLATVILLKSSFAANSQTTDTLCLPLDKANQVMKDARKVPVLEDRIRILEIDIAIYTERIRVKDSVITELKIVGAADAETIELLESQKRSLQDIKKEQERQLVLDKKILKKEMRKANFWKGAAITIAGAAAYLYITK